MPRSSGSLLTTVLLIVPLTIYAGQLRTGDAASLTTSELNRCLSAVRALCARRIAKPSTDQPIVEANIRLVTTFQIEFALPRG
jgi:hypothetical protein